MNVVSKKFSLFLICSHGFSVLIEIKRGTILPRFADEKNPREKEDKRQSYNKIKRGTYVELLLHG
jgi:hypothetical protein